MSGISGFFYLEKDLSEHENYYKGLLENMQQALEHRGPDERNIWLSAHFGMAGCRLADTASHERPFHIEIRRGEYFYGIVFDGELYNKKELLMLLAEKDCFLSSSRDEDIVLNGYLEYGPDFVKHLNGVFAFAIADTKENVLMLFRDRFGIKPLFYSKFEQEILFASEQKGLFTSPSIHPTIDKHGLNEIFSLGPAKTYGCGVYVGIDEVLPGNYITFSKGGLLTTRYWQLMSNPHTDSYEKTVEKTVFLVNDAIKRQMKSNTPICTLLSGGLDSSLVSAVCAGQMKQANKRLTTFSFDFADSEKHFNSNSFQPSLDRPYVDKMVDFLQSDHHYLVCDNVTQADLLYASVEARDMPAMADVDSSLLHFCSLVTDYSKVALTGECADEIFGGYPWFHKKECLESHTFPWTMDLSARKALLRDDFLEFLQMDDYIQNAYENSIAEVPALVSETPLEARRREISYLNLKWFMQTLIDRMDRTSMHSGLTARVPFADYRIVEYLWNVPWDMKTKDGIVKGLLREAGKGVLPDDILYRQKSPYPKTYDTNYEALVAERMRDILHTASSPVLNFIDGKKAESFMKRPSNYTTPWYGQLMAGPQMLAYMIQVNYWLKKYQIDVI